MPKQQAEKSKCSVVGCINPHHSIHRPPGSEPLRSAWLNFIFNGIVLTSVGKVFFVCAKHFREECFSNLYQYEGGLVKGLRLSKGSVPSVYGSDGQSKEVSCR
ncbi:hypothetical protein ATANTOWER_019188 [Ataeniobius toweri]|uniref:THAP-type domain-containing protein n=1 Tax=Ataeniobius toweri TaxID=208326 RepID=A0ABU7BGG7_9TELE|nr:hypothetical protein [Ataeniobius toweri]